VIPYPPEPDQRPERWDNHVLVYETLSEAFSLALGDAAITWLYPRPGLKVLDVGAGTGGAALVLAQRGCHVTAIDAAPAMIARLVQRATSENLVVQASVMDGQNLCYGDATFDAALSILGVVLFPDASRGLSEMRRVVHPGGRVAVVTWTEPQNYELAVQLRAAVQAVKPSTGSSNLPAQLRYRERADFEALFHEAGFAKVEIATHRAILRAPSARWIGERLRFAPGMAAQLDALGDQAPVVVERFVTLLEATQGVGPVEFAGVVFVGAAVV
jgi:ubiquinone/menaquinone biosynthesis C-methylase UbiE